MVGYAAWPCARKPGPASSHVFHASEINIGNRKAVSTTNPCPALSAVRQDVFNTGRPDHAPFWQEGVDRLQHLTDVAAPTAKAGQRDSVASHRCRRRFGWPRRL